MKRKHTLRNLLSMVCVIAMIISMVPVLPAAAADGTVGSAKAGGVIDFVDANEIENTEAVAITAGMGLFAGTTEGKFDPKGTVTRAQMATIIVKMLRGSDFNADNFKGINKFSDTASFEGGWAEGYINACVQLGVVAGYGDGTFKPGQAVTTAEALTMIINALKVDAGAGQWPTTIMAKAQEMKLYGDLAVKPGTYDALTRDQLAVLAYEGLCYSPSNVSGYKVPGSDIVFTDVADALKVCRDPSLITEVVGEDALANKIYELKVFEGYITANQATGDNTFTTVTAYNADGSTAPVSVDFNMETGLDEIGHYVTVYYRDEYKNDIEPGTVYNYVDETQVVVVTEDITTSKEYKEAFGKTTKEAALINGSDAVLLIAGNYTTSVIDNSTRGSITGYTEGTAAKEGTYLIDDGVVKAYMAPVPVVASKVLSVNNYEDNESIELSGVNTAIANSVDNDLIREYEGIAKNDYVTYTVVGTGANAIYVLTKAEAVTGYVAKTSVNKDNENVVTIGDTDYVQFGGTNNAFQNLTAINYTEEYILYVTADGKYLGWEQATGGANLDDTVFILGELTVVVDDGYGGKVRKTTARGVDMNGNEVNLLLKIEKNGTVENGVFFPSVVADDNISDPSYASVAANSFYVAKESKDKDAQKEGIYTLTPYTNSYDKDTAPLYTASRTVANNTAYGFTNLLLNNKRTWTTSDAVFMLLEGTVDQPTALTPIVKNTWDVTINNTGSIMYHYYLLSRDSSDEQQIEVAMMVVSQNIDAATESFPIYVSEDARKPVAVDANGSVFEVYDIVTGEKKNITLKTTDALLNQSGEIPSVGFWNTIVEAGSVCSVLANKIPDSTATSGTASNTTAGDGLYYEDIHHNEQLLEIAGGEMYTTGVQRVQKYTQGIVVDTRSEDAITGFGIGKIDSVDRIATLLANNENLTITFDMCFSTKNHALQTLFIRDVYYSSQEGGAEIKNVNGVYYLDGREVSSAVVITDATGTGVLTGTTDNKLNLLNTNVANGYIVDLGYTLTNGKVGTITLNSMMKPGTIWEETFDTYANGSKYDYTAEGATLVPWAAANMKGTNSFDIVDGVLKVSATGATSETRSWLKSSKADFNDSYTIEVRFKQDAPSSTMTVTSYLRFPGLNINGEAGDMQIRFMKDGTFKIFADLTKDYVHDFAQKVDYTQWHVIKIHVYEPTPDSPDTAFTIELYDDAGRMIESHVVAKGGDVTSVQSAANAISFETYSSAGKTEVAYWDYIKVKTFELGASSEVVTYDVTYEDVYEGGLLSADVAEAAEGDTVTFTTTAKKGYKLNKLLVNGTDILVTNSNLNTVIETQYTMPAADIEVEAEFVKIASSAVTIPANDKGVVTVTVNGQPVNSGDLILEGTVLTINVTTNDPVNWMLASINVNGTKYADKTDTTTLVMPAEPVEITGEYDQIIYCDVAVKAGIIDGTIALSPSGNDIPYGTEITVTATPKAGFELAKLYVNGVESADKTKFTLVEDCVVDAVFWPVGSLYYENFDGYTNGAAYTAGSAYSTAYGAASIFYEYPDKANYTLTTDVVDGATVLTAKADTYNNNALQLNWKTSGSYVIETRFKSVDAAWTVLQDTSIWSTKKDSGKTGTAKYMLYCGPTQNLQIYRASSAGGRDTALLTTSNFKPYCQNKWLTWKVTVDATNNTVKTELFDENNALIKDFVWNSTTVDNLDFKPGFIGFDVRATGNGTGTADDVPGTILLDYVKVTKL